MAIGCVRVPSMCTPLSQCSTISLKLNMPWKTFAAGFGHPGVPGLEVRSGWTRGLSVAGSSNCSLARQQRHGGRSLTQLHRRDPCDSINEAKDIGIQLLMDHHTPGKLSAALTGRAGGIILNFWS